MIEPTETESKEDLDVFIESFKNVVKDAKENPEMLHDAPRKPKLRRLDETSAARHPCLTC
jgi:glycine dehydrogenase subunit 2